MEKHKQKHTRFIINIYTLNFLDMGLINEPKKKEIQNKKEQDPLASFVTFRCTNAELEKLKAQAKADKRNLSNFIHSRLF